MAAEFAIPVSTLLCWVAEMDWPRRRDGGRLPAPTLIPAPTAPQAASDAPDEDPIPTRPPRLLTTLESVSALARRELADLAAHRARNFEERACAAPPILPVAFYVPSMTVKAPGGARLRAPARALFSGRLRQIKDIPRAPLRGFAPNAPAGAHDTQGGRSSRRDRRLRKGTSCPPEPMRNASPARA